MANTKRKKGHNNLRQTQHRTHDNAHPILDLAVLAEGCPALTKANGSTLCEAAAVCLSDVHTPTTMLGVQGTVNTQYTLSWPIATEQAKRTYADPEVATELGACGVAIMVLKDQTGLTVVERSRKGTGFDYWIGPDDGLFQKKARLEVSGIRRARPKAIERRVAAKKKQTMRSDALAIAAFIVVVEFGSPQVAYEVRS